MDLFASTTPIEELDGCVQVCNTFRAAALKSISPLGVAVEQYGIYPSAVARARSLRRRARPVVDAVAALFEDQFGQPDGMAFGLVLATGVDLFVDVAAAELDCSADEVREALLSRYSRQLAGDFSLTGGEAVALLLRQEKVATAFAYAGTSELAICDALARLPGLRLINGRGDKD